MSSILFTSNQGSQNISFTYGEQEIAHLFNKISSKLFPTGLYEGFDLTRASNTTISIAPGVAFIADANHVLDGSGNPLNIRVRAETFSAIVLDLATAPAGNTFDSSKPWIVLRFGWGDQAACYANALAVGYSNDSGNVNPALILPTDIILGQVNADASGSPTIILASDPFDLTRKQRSCLPLLQDVSTQLQVQTCVTDATKVTVTAGSIRTGQGFKVVSGGNTAAIPSTTLGRIDLIWVNDLGVVQVLQGADAASPTAPIYNGRKVLAEIRRGAARTTIRGSDIFMVDSSGVGSTFSPPIGTILSYDGAWVDNVTLPGWYACTGSNGTPNLVGKFLFGGSSSGTSGGSNSHTISSAELPTHIHSLSSHTHSTPNHSHSLSNHTHDTALGSHAHGIYVGYNAGAHTSFTAVVRQFSVGIVDGGADAAIIATDLGTKTSGGPSTNSTDSSGGGTSGGPSNNSSGDGGFANTAIDIRPAFYTVIFIKKMAA